jgi:hypothetical protein
MARRFDPVKINIVEQDGWEHYDSSGKLLEYASDSAFQEFEAYRKTDAKRWVEDILGAKAGDKDPRDWNPTRLVLTDEQLDVLAQALSERKLEQASQMVLDALTYSWEEAYTPTDRDIKNALDEADDDMLREADFYETAEELWAPLLETGWDSERILKGLLNVVTYEREADHYDRYVNFEWSDAEPVLAITPFLLADRETAPNKIVRLSAWLKDFANDFMVRFFKRLDGQMKGVDFSNRTDFTSQWTTILKDKAAVKLARKEIAEYLKELGDLEDNQARLIASALLSKTDSDGMISAEAVGEILGGAAQESYRAQTVQETARLLGFSEGQIERYIVRRRAHGR